MTADQWHQWVDRHCPKCNQTRKHRRITDDPDPTYHVDICQSCLTHQAVRGTAGHGVAGLGRTRQDSAELGVAELGAAELGKEQT